MQILLLKVNSLPLGKIIAESFTFDLHSHSIYCLDIIIAGGLYSYQVTTVHLVTHMSLRLLSSWPKRGLWRPWTLRDLQPARAFWNCPLPIPSTNAASQEKLFLSLSSGACSPVMLPALIHTCSFYAFLFPVFIYFKKKKSGSFLLGLVSLSPE